MAYQEVYYGVANVIILDILKSCPRFVLVLEI